MLYIGGKKLRNRVKLSTKVKTCVPNLAVVRRFDCILKILWHSFEVLCFIYNNVSSIRYKVIIILRKLEVLCNGGFHQCIKRETS